jgi:hypothetical protein
MEEDAEGKAQDRSLPVDLIQERAVADPLFPSAQAMNQISRDLFEKINSDVRPHIAALPPLNPAELQAALQAPREEVL